MSNSQITARNPSSSCARATGVSCLTLVVLIVIFAYWFKAVIANQPSYQQLATCTENAQEISGALNRYSIRNQRYPDKLADLYPDFLENKSVLHCPADPSAAGNVSYDYWPPKMDAPDSFIVLTCHRHIPMKNVPVITFVRLMKSGEISPIPIKPADLAQTIEALKHQEKKPVEKPEKDKTAPTR